MLRLLDASMRLADQALILLKSKGSASFPFIRFIRLHRRVLHIVLFNM